MLVSWFVPGGRVRVGRRMTDDHYQRVHAGTEEVWHTVESNERAELEGHSNETKRGLQGDSTR